VVRSVLRQAKPQDYRFSSLVLGIVNSDPFQSIRVPELEDAIRPIRASVSGSTTRPQ
jgi:hypothetical protein